MEFTHVSVLWMEWRHFLSQIQRQNSDNNVPGLTPSYNNVYLWMAMTDISGFIDMEQVLFWNRVVVMTEEHILLAASLDTARPSGQALLN